MHLNENTLFDLDLGVKVRQDVAQFPLYHATHSDTKFEVATSNSLGGDAFTSKYTSILGSRSHKMLPSTLYIMRIIQVQSFKLLCLTVKEKMHLKENT